MPDHKHLTLDHRSFIQTSLQTGHSFRRIALALNKDPTAISKEVRNRRTLTITGAVGRTPNKCIHLPVCSITALCNHSNCSRLCKRCNKCNAICPDFVEEHCPLLERSPYVCNGCKQRNRCVLTKYFYRAASAHNAYRFCLSTSREGLSYTESEILWMDQVITPLVKKKQSIHHICVSQADNLLCSQRTLYKLIDQGVLSVRNIDLPRKVRYRPRHCSKPYKVDKKCRIGRTHEDFLLYMKEHPDTPVVQMDSVEGTKGGKVLLTVLFTQSDLMLMFLRDHNTSQSVLDIFDMLDKTLGTQTFERLFSVILTDNGSEFSNPRALEINSSGVQRTRIFYCDPSSPHQKAEIERSHEYIRMVLPKGSSFEILSQDNVTILSCHINSLIRKKLNDRSPITTFSFFHGEDILRKLDLEAILPAEVNLSNRLLFTAKEGTNADNV